MLPRIVAAAPVDLGVRWSYPRGSAGAPKFQGSNGCWRLHAHVCLRVRPRACLEPANNFGLLPGLSRYQSTWARNTY